MFSFFSFLIDSFVTYMLNIIFGLFSSINPIKQCEVFETRLFDQNVITEDEKHISKQKKNMLFYEGCVVHSIYNNRSDKDVAIRQMQLKIESVKSRSIKKVDMLCHFNNNKLYLYLINNGNIDAYNVKAKINLIFDTENFQESVPLPFQKKLLGDMFDDTYYVEHLRAGEIVRLGIWYPDGDYYKKNYHNNYYGRIVIQGSISDEKEFLLQNQFLGALILSGEDLEYCYAQGESGDVEDFRVMIKGKHPQSFTLPLQYAISGKGTKHVQVSVYPSETCVFRYHFELYIAGKKHVYKSSTSSAKVFVPLYEPDGGYYFKLREWLMKNGIVSYRYNENRLLQQEIEPRKKI